MTTFVAIGRRVSSSQARLRGLVVRAQAAIFLAALLLPLTGWGGLDRAIDVGGLAVFPSDLLVVAAVASAVALRLLSRDREWPRMLSTPVLGWPLLAFAVLLIPGIVRGHERYGESFVSQPVRLVIYAGIAAAMTEIRAAQAWRWITVALYAGAVWQAILAVYYIATGTSQTSIASLSTGGTRTLSLTTGMFLGTALVAAIVNLDLERKRRRQLVHALFGAIAAAGIVLSFGRTTLLALAVVLVFLAWKLPDARRKAILAWRWWVPALVAVAAAVAVIAPSTATRVVDRVSANPLHDQSVRWRVAGIHAALAGMKDGEWDMSNGLYTGNSTGNHLVNPGFESGTAGWYVQGGGIHTVPAVADGFGARSLMLSTMGAADDEGWYSSPVVAKAGQTWLYTTWLEGKRGGERMNVAIWEYDQYKLPIHRAELPAVLTSEPTQYSVEAIIKDPAVRYLRVLVRTRDAENVTVYGDVSALRRVVGSSAAGGVASPGSHGAVLSPTIRPDGLGIGDNEATDAAAGPDLLADGSSKRWSAVGGREGYVSDPVAVQPGQTLSYSVRLRGAQDGEKALVAIRLFHGRGLESRVGAMDFPVNLTDKPARYVVTGVVPPGAARYARAAVRARHAPGQATVLMDGGELRSQAANPPSIFVTPIRGASYQLDEPLLGLGFGRETRYAWDGGYYEVEGDPDNSYVYLLAGGGVLALGGFLVLLGSFVRDAFRRLGGAMGTKRALVVWALAAWFIVAANCAMAPFLPRPKIALSLWAIMLVPALVRQVRRERAR